MARNRFNNALAIQQGACNPVAITNSLKDAIDEIRANTQDTQAILDDPAIRLIVHQLAYLCRTYQIDDSISEYDRLLTECEAKRIA